MLNFYRLSQDYLKFTGSERLDLINRLSTNGVNSLEKFHGIKTILLSDKGRFIDLLTIYNFGDFIFSSCSLNNSSSVISYLDKYTIMDDFIPHNLKGSHETLHFYGDMLKEFISLITGIDISGFNGNNFIVTGDHDAVIANNDDAFGGIYFIYSAEDKDYWNDLIFTNENINMFSIKEVSGDSYEIQRILYGIPKFGFEISELTNPLECGLERYVSFTKGCYIGQEVIARLDAYDKISKHMVGISFNGDLEISDNEKIKITLDEKECGFVTSAVKSDNSGFIGLGFIKTIFLNFGNQYNIKYNERELECRIQKLPFTVQINNNTI